MKFLVLLSLLGGIQYSNTDWCMWDKYLRNNGVRQYLLHEKNISITEASSSLPMFQSITRKNKWDIIYTGISRYGPISIFCSNDKMPKIFIDHDAFTIPVNGYFRYYDHEEGIIYLKNCEFTLITKSSSK